MQWAGTRAQHTEPGSRHHHLTGAGGGQGQPGASCDAQKVWRGTPTYTYLCTYTFLRPHPHPRPAFPPFPFQERSILLSIESLGQTLLGSVAGIPHNALEKAAWTVAVRTKAVMHRHCRTSSRVCVLNCPSTKDCHTNVPRLPSGLSTGCEIKARVQDLYAHTYNWSPLADPAAQEASRTAPSQPEEAPATCPARCRHLLGEALFAECHGHQRILALPLSLCPHLTEDWKQALVHVLTVPPPSAHTACTQRPRMWRRDHTPSWLFFHIPSEAPINGVRVWPDSSTFA